MDFRCPNCQKDLTVPDEYAGQLMKCPLCENTFQAPALPPPVPPPPAPRAVYGVANDASPTVPSAPASPVPPPPPPIPPAPPRAAAPEPPLPAGDYTRTRTIHLSPRVVPWVTPVALAVLFVLSFFSWGVVVPGGEGPSAWGWGFPKLNILTLLYLLLLLLAAMLTAANTFFQQSAAAKRLPSALRQLWPWRAAVVALVLFLAFFFLTLQLLTGFQPPAEGALVFATGWARLALVVHLTALVAALLDFWLEQRGPGKPWPRLDLRW